MPLRLRECFNSIDPHNLAPLTLMIMSSTPLHNEYLKGVFKPLTPIETLIELKNMLKRFELSNCIFQA